MSNDTIREALTTAMMHSEAPMVLSDPHLADCPMIAVNHPFCALTGYQPDAIVGRNCRFLQGARTDPAATRRIRACLDAQSGCIEWITNYRADGTMFWNLLFLSPVRDADGTLRYYFGNQLDITHGFPTWLVDVSFGRAHLRPDLEQEFHAMLRDVDLAARVRSLDRIVQAARRLAEISVSLAPGTLTSATQAA